MFSTGSLGHTPEFLPDLGVNPGFQSWSSTVFILFSLSPDHYSSHSVNGTGSPHVLGAVSGPWTAAKDPVSHTRTLPDKVRVECPTVLIVREGEGLPVSKSEGVLGALRGLKCREGK